MKHDAKFSSGNPVLFTHPLSTSPPPPLKRDTEPGKVKASVVKFKALLPSLSSFPNFFSFQQLSGNANKLGECDGGSGAKCFKQREGEEERKERE